MSNNCTVYEPAFFRGVERKRKARRYPFCRRCVRRGKPLKVYQVVRRGRTWHVLMPDAGREVDASQDKSRVIASACELARSNDGTVQVRDIGGQVEMTYTYGGGVEASQDPAQSGQSAPTLKR